MSRLRVQPKDRGFIRRKFVFFGGRPQRWLVSRSIGTSVDAYDQKMFLRLKRMGLCSFESTIFGAGYVSAKLTETGDVLAQEIANKLNT